jgi:outer membrane protein TolC
LVDRPTLSWPIFDAGKIRANIAVQEARTDQQLSTYEQTVLTALEEVENALVAYSREQVRCAQLADAVEANQRRRWPMISIATASAIF